MDLQAIIFPAGTEVPENQSVLNYSRYEAIPIEWRPFITECIVGGDTSIYLIDF